MIGIKLASGDFYPILGNDEAVAKRMILTTVEDDQDAVHIELWRSPGPTMAGASYLASLVISGIEPRPAQEPDIELLVANEEDGRVKAQARDLSSESEDGLDLSLTLVGPADESLPDFEIDQESSFGADDAVSDAFRAAGAASMEPPEPSMVLDDFGVPEEEDASQDVASPPSLGPEQDLEIPDLSWDSEPGMEGRGEESGMEEETVPDAGLAEEEPYPGYAGPSEEEGRDAASLPRIDRSAYGIDQARNDQDRNGGYTQPRITTDASSQVPPRDRRMGAAAIVLLVLAGLLALAGLGYIVYRLSSGFSWRKAPDPADVALIRSIASTLPAASPAPSPTATALSGAAAVASPRAPSPSQTATAVPSSPKPSPGINGSKGLNHKIRWGDTLWDISTRYYGTPWLYKKIAAANSIRDPNLIISGRTLWIPPK